MYRSIKTTRGWGLFEGLLAKKRAGIANKLIAKLQKKGKILDIGCGSYPYFLLNTNFAEKYGVDPALNFLSIKDINLQRLDVTKQKLPFKDNFFAAITMLAVFEHLDYERLNFVLKEIGRVLERGGLLVITTPAPWSDKLLHFMALFYLISKEEIHEHKHHYNKEEIEKILQQAAFAENNVESGYFELGLNMWFTGKK
jgi:ubiquinone/menaquinone biosynthesis C-methylase UbiE